MPVQRQDSQVAWQHLVILGKASSGINQPESIGDTYLGSVIHIHPRALPKMRDVAIDLLDDRVPILRCSLHRLLNKFWHGMTKICVRCIQKLSDITMPVHAFGYPVENAVRSVIRDRNGQHLFRECRIISTSSAQ